MNSLLNIPTLPPLLPPDVSPWGLNLVTQFHGALSSDLQEILMADHTYTAPNLASLTDRSKQLGVLRLTCCRLSLFSSEDPREANCPHRSPKIETHPFRPDC